MKFGGALSLAVAHIKRSGEARELRDLVVNGEGSGFSGSSNFGGVQDCLVNEAPAVPESHQNIKGTGYKWTPSRLVIVHG